MPEFSFDIAEYKHWKCINRNSDMDIIRLEMPKSASVLTGDWGVVYVTVACIREVG